MKIITLKDKLKSLSEDWRDRYLSPYDRSWTTYPIDTEQIYFKIKDLENKNALTIENIKDFIQIDWFETFCDECHNKTISYIEIGKSRICKDCISTACSIGKIDE